MGVLHKGLALFIVAPKVIFTGIILKYPVRNFTDLITAILINVSATIKTRVFSSYFTLRNKSDIQQMQLCPIDNYCLLFIIELLLPCLKSRM